MGSLLQCREGGREEGQKVTSAALYLCISLESIFVISEIRPGGQHICHVSKHVSQVQGVVNQKKTTQKQLCQQEAHTNLTSTHAQTETTVYSLILISYIKMTGTDHQSIWELISVFVYLLCGFV